MSKKANLVVMGGPISVGKSTLVQELPLPSVPELTAASALEALLLTLLYEKTRVPNEVVELYFLLTREASYRAYADQARVHILDRSLFESLWFAQQTLAPESFAAFAKLWRATLSALISEHGKPRLYVLLTCSWATFKERLFKRGREFEILNFQQNRAYFRQHIAEYAQAMRQIFAEFALDYVEINTDGKLPADVKAEVLAALAAHNII